MNTSSRIWLKIYLKIMMFTFKHPKYYTELRKLRNRAVQSSRTDSPQSDQAISDEASTEATSVRPDPGHKLQAPSVKLSNQPDRASSDKRQAPSSKRQA